jgi:nitrite reductase (NO-forming)
MGRIFLFASAVLSVLLLTLIYALIALQGGGAPAASGSPLPSGPAASGAPSGSGSPSGSAAPSGSGAPAASGGPAGSAAPLGTITIKAFDLGFDPKTIDVSQPGVYTLVFNNTGKLAHDVTLADGTKIPAEPGQTATATVTIPAGGTAFHCSVDGHAAAGMTGVITVAGAGPSPGG